MSNNNVENNNVENKLENYENIKISGCISNANLIKYFVQIFFSTILIVFCIFMISSSKEPSNETLWITLLTSTVAIFTNPPKLEKDNLRL